MLSLRSDLLMTSTPVFSSTTEKKLAGRARARQQLQESKRKRQHRNDEDDGLDDSSKLTRSTAASIEPAHAILLATHSERLQAAGIAQLRLAHLGKKKAKLNDRIVLMHMKRVTGKQSIIAERKFLLSATATDNPNRHVYLLELWKLNLELARAIQDLLTLAEEQIIEADVEETLDVNNVEVMIDATIASVLEQQQMRDDDEGDVVDRTI
jgi:hypothetical protein